MASAKEGHSSDQGIVVDQEAFFAHLSALSETLQWQVKNVRACLDLSKNQPVAFKQAAGSAITKLDAAVRVFREDIYCASTSTMSEMDIVPGEKSGVFGWALEPQREERAVGSSMVATTRLTERSVAESRPRTPQERLRSERQLSFNTGATGSYPLSPARSDGKERTSWRGLDLIDSSGASGEGDRSIPLSQVRSDSATNVVHVTTSEVPGQAETPVAKMKSSSCSAEKVLRMQGQTRELPDIDMEDKDTLVCPSGVMNPQWSGRLAWDMVVIFSVLVDSMVLPFQFAFKNDMDNDAFDDFWLWLTTSLFAIDLVLNFHTGYLSGPSDPHLPPGTLITDKFKIAKHYLRTWFAIDLVATIPWPQLVDSMSGEEQVAKLSKAVKFVRFLRLMRMLRLAKLGLIWERIEIHLGVFLLQIIALLRVLFVVVLICHWNACIWWMVGLPKSLFTEVLSKEAQMHYEFEIPHWTTVQRSDSAYDPTWTWLEKSSAESYTFCFYWTLGVMRTMPAEVTPVNLPERIFVLVFMFIALSAFAICVAMITQAWFKFSERRRAFNEEMAFVRMHLRKVRANETLQTKVKTQLRHVFDQRKIHAKETQLLGILPDKTKKLLMRSQALFHLAKIPGKDMPELSVRALERVADSAEIKDMFPGDVLSTCGTVATSAYVLVSGRLLVTSGGGNGNGDKVTCPTIVDALCLGAEDDYKSPLTVIVAESSEVMRFDKAKFSEEVNKHKEFLLRQRRSQGGDSKGGHSRADLSEESDPVEADAHASAPNRDNSGRDFQHLHSDNQNMPDLAVVLASQNAVSG